MGDALDTLTLRELSDRIRASIGTDAEALEHTVDVIVTEVCRCWPERVMAACARNLESEKNGATAVHGVAVVTAKVRENIEARWGCKPSHKAALDLVLRGCVVEFANLWFSSAEARIALRAIIGLVRLGKARLD